MYPPVSPDSRLEIPTVCSSLRASKRDERGKGNEREKECEMRKGMDEGGKVKEQSVGNKCEGKMKVKG